MLGQPGDGPERFVAFLVPPRRPSPDCRVMRPWITGEHRDPGSWHQGGGTKQTAGPGGKKLVFETSAPRLGPKHRWQLGVAGHEDLLIVGLIGEGRPAALEIVEQVRCRSDLEPHYRGIADPIFRLRPITDESELAGLMVEEGVERPGDHHVKVEEQHGPGERAQLSRPEGQLTPRAWLQAWGEANGGDGLDFDPWIEVRGIIGENHEAGRAGHVA